MRPFIVRIPEDTAAQPWTPGWINWDANRGSSRLRIWLVIPLGFPRFAIRYNIETDRHEWTRFTPTAKLTFRWRAAHIGGKRAYFYWKTNR